MKNKFLFLFVILLFVSLPLVMAVPKPVPRPQIKDFSYETRNVFIPLLNIFVDKETIKFGESATFIINLTTAIPDNDYSDGLYSVQYAGWIFSDKEGNIIDSKEFTRVYGSFSDVVIVKPIAGEYVLIGLIIQYDQTYDLATNSWITSPEEVKIKEAKKLTVTSLPVPPIPSRPSIIEWLGNIFQSIMDWFSELFR